MIVRSTDSPAVTLALRGYLRERLEAHDLYFRTPPTLIPDGFEVFTFRLELGGNVPALYNRPLILRLYATSHGLPMLRHEHAVQEHLARLGFSVARPLLAEEDHEPLGGPFMLMECLPGETMLESMFRRPWQVFIAPFQMGAVHARLHALPADGFPAPDRPFLDRSLETLEERLDLYNLAGLRPGLRWLREHRPADPEKLSILHLDFHPVNLLYHRGRIRGAIDWPEADVGDYHADVATTMMLMETTALGSIEVPSLTHRLLALPGRLMLRRFYRRGYGARRLDRSRLAYYIALAALRRLSRWGVWLRSSPAVTGCKPRALELLADGGIARLAHCFRRRTGVAIDLLDGLCCRQLRPSGVE